MQSQKFTAVVESMQRGETLVALKTISTLTSKEKNKAKLSENELKLIHVLKALCLSKMHEYGESHSLIMNFLKNEKNVMFSEGNVIHWLDYIASGLHLYKDVREFSGNLYNKAGNKEEHLIEYMNLCVKEYNHHEVFSSALRLYKLTNNVKYMFINVIYQYRSILNTAEVVELPKKLEIVYLFTEKLMKDLKIDTEKKNEFEKIHHQAVNFALTLCKKQQKHQKALEILDKYQWAFEDFRESIGHFSEINSFVKTEDSRLALINKYYSKFQKDQNLDKLVMQFELYEKFIDFLFEEIKDFQYPEGFFENLTQTENYKDSEYFKPLKGNITNNDLLLDFFSNLAGLKHDTNLQKNHKNYKSALQIFISAKILLLLKSLKYLKDDNETQRNMIFPYYHRLLEEYIDNFSTTFTFSEEFQVLIKDMPILTLETAFNQIENTQKDQKLPNRYIREVSLMKLRLCNGLGETAYTLKGVLALVKQALRLYEQGFLDLELENKYLEKGERHFIDDFLIIAADVVLHYHRCQANLDDSIFSLLLHILVFLEAGLLKSPYNFDIKLRLLMIYEVVAFTERSIEILRTLDIKSIQHDTLGFLYAKIYFNYQNNNLTQDFFTGALNFYSENLRESKESILACLKNGAYDKLEEFELYDQWIDNSYYKQICLFTKLESFLKTSKIDNINELNIQYYVDLLKNKCKQPNNLTWNIDMKTIKPCFPGNYYINYLDLYNDFEIYKLHFFRTQLEIFLRKPKNLEEMEIIFKEFVSLLDQVNFEKMFDFSIFKTRSPLIKVNQDIYTRNTLEKKFVFELINLSLEKSIFLISIRTLKFKQEENHIDEVIKELKQLNSNNSILTEYFFENLNKNKIVPSFNRENLMNISRYLNKTIEIVQKFLRLVSEIMPNLNKATKKGDEELKKKCIVLQKAFNTGYKELLDYSLKNLSIIQDYLQEMQDLSVEGKWGKNIKEIIKANKNISEELSLINGKVFMLETQEKNMISMLLSECKLFSMFNISNVKELSKALKSVKF